MITHMAKRTMYCIVLVMETLNYPGRQNIITRVLVSETGDDNIRDRFENLGFKDEGKD